MISNCGVHPSIVSVRLIDTFLVAVHLPSHMYIASGVHLPEPSEKSYFYDCTSLFDVECQSPSLMYKSNLLAIKCVILKTIKINDHKKA